MPGFSTCPGGGERREGGCAIADKSIGEGFQNSKYNFILNRGSLNFDMKKNFFLVFSVFRLILVRLQKGKIIVWNW